MAHHLSMVSYGTPGLADGVHYNCPCLSVRPSFYPSVHLSFDIWETAHLVILWDGYRLECDVETFTCGGEGFWVGRNSRLLSTGRSDTLIPLGHTKWLKGDLNS